MRGGKPLAHSLTPSWPFAFHLSGTWVIFRWRLPTVSIKTLQRLSPALSLTVHYVEECVIMSDLAVIYVPYIKTLLPDLFFWGKWRHNKNEIKCANAVLLANVPITKMTFCFLVSTGKPGGIFERKKRLYYNQITALSCHVVQSMLLTNENNKMRIMQVYQ